MEFGFMIREERIKHGLTLREFCRQNQCQPANQSRLERGVLSPPRDPHLVEWYLDALDIPREHRRIFFIAAKHYWVERICSEFEPYTVILKNGDTIDL